MAFKKFSYILGAKNWNQKSETNQKKDMFRWIDLAFSVTLQGMMISPTLGPWKIIDSKVPWERGTLPSSKLTWQWKITILSRRYIFISDPCSIGMLVYRSVGDMLVSHVLQLCAISFFLWPPAPFARHAAVGESGRQISSENALRLSKSHRGKTACPTGCMRFRLKIIHKINEWYNLVSAIPLSMNKPRDK